MVGGGDEGIIYNLQGRTKYWSNECRLGVAKNN